MFITFLPYSNQYGALDDHMEYESHDPETIFDYLIDKIESNKKTTHCWIAGLDLIIYDIISGVLKCGYRDVTTEKKPLSKFHVCEFDYTISSNGSSYRMRIKTHSKKIFTIFNANNIVGKDVDSVIKSYVMQPSQDKVQDYTYAIAIAIPMITGVTPKSKRIPFTISMCAQRSWKRICGIEFGEENLIDCYNVIMESGQNLDEFLRDAYRGGWCYRSSLADHGKVGSGVVLDVNSLYPYVMARMPLPWGEPYFFTGEIPEIAKGDRYYYFVKVKCRFNLKEGYLPYIGIYDWIHGWGQPLTTSDYIDPTGQHHSHYIDLDGQKREVTAELTLTRSDLEVMQKAYKIEDLQIIEGVYFRTSRFIFKDFVEIFYDDKADARAKGDKARERKDKMILNSLSGSLAKIRDRESIAYIEEHSGHLEEMVMKTRSQSKSYIHIAAAILAYARRYIYEKAVANIERFLYSDTDSLHLLGDDPAIGVHISTKLGDFKVEKEFEEAIYFKRKLYAFKDCTGSYHLTFAGLSKEYRDYIECLLDANNDFEALKLIMSKDCDVEPQGDERFSDEVDPSTVGNRDHLVKSKLYEAFLETRSRFVNSDDKFMELATQAIPNGYIECENFRAHRYTQFMRI